MSPPQSNDAPGVIRTHDLRIRSPLLYPAELRGPGATARNIGHLTRLEQKRVESGPMSSGQDDEGDLTRKQRREQARGERKALEQAEAARAKRRARLTQLGIVVAVVVVVIVGIAIASGGGGKTTVTTAGTPQANATTAEVKTLIGGIPQSGNTLGDPNAPVTLKYFGDLECPICKEFTLGRAADADPEVRAHGEAADRIPLAGDGHTRTGSLQNPAGRGLCRRQAEPRLVLHRDLLPRAGRRGLGLRQRKIPAGDRLAGSRAEPRRLDRRAQRTDVRQRGHRRRPSRQQCRLHRHAVLPARQDRRHVAKVRTGHLHRSRAIRSAIEKLLKG